MNKQWEKLYNHIILVSVRDHPYLWGNSFCFNFIFICRLILLIWTLCKNACFYILYSVNSTNLQRNVFLLNYYPFGIMTIIFIWSQSMLPPLWKWDRRASAHAQKSHNFLLYWNPCLFFKMEAAVWLHMKIIVSLK